MPNIGALLKQEITRLSRKEIRGEVQATRKASAQYRKHIAALKRQVATLERQVALLQRRVLATPSMVKSGSATQNIRFVAKGLKSQRNRLGLSAADYGSLVGVSAQSIYNWEQGHASPRPAQLKMIAALRSVGKRDAQERVKQRGVRASKRSRRS
jgi:DNA-binding transcriptional regulator YiaG